ncbi:fatty acid binding protein 1-B.1-like [Chrysoperla carnea]|uniref:fatty acid binding protein 1-B.1-like n=1 Tax=Chrysoperla carnea TaxID=189513 RepID=UPI001D08F951|nr:fatty acid binding protein 1-B.1-like [Chrysoperla carnea]
MASALAGKYEYKSHEKIVEFYKSWNLPDNLIEKLTPKPGTKREISVDGNKITLDGGQPLILDTEVDENINNYPVKSTAKMEGNTLIVHSKSVKHEGGLLIRSYNVNENLLTITLTTNKVGLEAKIFFTRI